jgi:hypothetical protein
MIQRKFKYSARYGFYLLNILLIFSSCNQNSPETQRYGAGNTKRGHLDILRYERALFDISPNSVRNGLSSLYPDYKFFLGDSWEDTLNILRIHNYITDPNIRELNRLVDQNYPDMDFLEDPLAEAFGNIMEYYPKTSIPKVFTYVSGLDVENPIIYADSVLAISLDLYMGENEGAYQKAGIPKYICHRLTRNNLLSDCIYAVAATKVKIDESKQSLLDQMLAAGKILYFVDLILPETADEYKIGYETVKLQWCNHNESNIWQFLIGNQMLFSSDPAVVSKMMTDAPFTSGLVNESPGRIGEWIGWQIIRSYAESNPSVRLEDLMNNTDAQSILKASKYKPGK